MQNQTTFDQQHLLDQPKYGFFKRVAINHAHPTKALFDLIGFIWMTYFLWQNNFSMAVASCALPFLGSILTLNADTEKVSQTTFGKYVVARLQPKSLFFQASGFFIMLYGVWAHETRVILVGITVVLLGHLWTWTKRAIP